MPLPWSISISWSVWCPAKLLTLLDSTISTVIHRSSVLGGGVESNPFFFALRKFEREIHKENKITSKAALLLVAGCLASSFLFQLVCCFVPLLSSPRFTFQSTFCVVTNNQKQTQKHKNNNQESPARQACIDRKTTAAPRFKTANGRI
jgi:hypothetical protein